LQHAPRPLPHWKFFFPPPVFILPIDCASALRKAFHNEYRYVPAHVLARSLARSLADAWYGRGDAGAPFMVRALALTAFLMQLPKMVTLSWYALGWSKEYVPMSLTFVGQYLNFKPSQSEPWWLLTHNIIFNALVIALLVMSVYGGNPWIRLMFTAIEMAAITIITMNFDRFGGTPMPVAHWFNGVPLFAMIAIHFALHRHYDTGPTSKEVQSPPLIELGAAYAWALATLHVVGWGESYIYSAVVIAFMVGWMAIVLLPPEVYFARYWSVERWYSLYAIFAGLPSLLEAILYFSFVPAFSVPVPNDGFVFYIGKHTLYLIRTRVIYVIRDLALTCALAFSPSKFAAATTVANDNGYYTVRWLICMSVLRIIITLAHATIIAVPN
jgi:hypothetical protein